MYARWTDMILSSCVGRIDDELVVTSRGVQPHVNERALRVALKLAFKVGDYRHLNGHRRMTFAEYQELDDTDKMAARVHALENVTRASDMIVLTRNCGPRKNVAASAVRRANTAKLTTVARPVKH